MEKRFYNYFHMCVNMFPQAMNCLKPYVTLWTAENCVLVVHLNMLFQVLSHSGQGKFLSSE